MDKMPMLDLDGVWVRVVDRVAGYSGNRWVFVLFIEGILRFY